MFFNSIDFLVFFSVVYLLYWYVANKKLTYRNVFILFASYVFYGWWDARFLALIFFSTCVDYFVGKQLGNEERPRARKMWLGLSLAINLGVLGFFKYFNFFLDSFIELLDSVGVESSVHTLAIVLPVGISFYTFQTLSYTIDVYRKELPPTKDFVGFAAFVSFFPQLVAGPIERAKNLLPQFSTLKTFDYQIAVSGLRMMLWGFLMKIVIADNCAPRVDAIFEDYNIADGSTLLLGAILFSFQIYGDFAGYSYIAIGVSRLFGFDLMRNFDKPYFSENIIVFWRRWHISLSTWFRDYVYLPLGGGRVSTMKAIRNIFAVFLISGFWHGANWTFILWGAFHAVLFLPLRFLPWLTRKTTSNYVVAMRIVTTFLLVSLGWVFFRAPSIDVAFVYLGKVFSPSLFSMPEISSRLLLLILFVFVFIEWMTRHEEHSLALEGVRSGLLRKTIYIVIIAALFFLTGTQQEFIYFQF